MIILSGVLVVAAIALLIGGVVSANSGTEVAGLDSLNLIYISIGVSIVSALFLAIGVYLRRKDLFGAPDDATTGPTARKTSKRGRRDKDKAAQTATPSGAVTGSPAKAGAIPGGPPIAGRASDADTAELTAALPPVADVPADAVVHVVPGRRRYHIDGCRHLSGRENQELTFEEAREEGFSPCTACMPDIALAARAVSGGPATDKPKDAQDAQDAQSTDSSESAADGPTEAFGTNGAAGDDNPASGTAAPAERPTTTSGADDAVANPAGGVGEPRSDKPQNPPGAAADVPPQAAAGDDKDRNDAPQVRILSGTKRYHRPDCALIEDIGEGADDLESLTRAEAKARGCTPCLVCQPDKEPAARD